MITRAQQRSRAIELLSAHLLRRGLAEANLRQLATAAGVSDRMLLYYFSDKTDVLAATMESIATKLAVQLAGAIPEGAELLPAELVRLATQVTTSGQMRPFMRLWIEIVAAAAREEAPFVDIARHIAAGFMQWIEARLVPSDQEAQRATAAAILAVIDGMALLEVCAGTQLTDRAAQVLASLIDGQP